MTREWSAQTVAVGIAELILVGLLVDWLFRQCRVPGLVGLLALGVVVGPFALDLLAPEILIISADLRLIALIVILLRAGFELSREVLLRVGRRAMLLACVPCLFEVAAVVLVAPPLLGLTRIEAAMLGAVLGAVSPAVVVPLMIRFIEEGRGAAKGIPTMVLAAASMDDVFAIVLTAAAVGVYVGDAPSPIWQLAAVPVAIATGVAVGMALGVLFCRLFDRFNPRATKRVLLLLGTSVLLVRLQHDVEHILPFAALLAVMTTGFVILERREHAAHEISQRLGKIWVFAHLLLFTMVGAEVNLPVAWEAGLAGAAVIGCGLLGRSLGVQLCLFGSALVPRERAFVGLTYLPKATVQAAIGSTPLLAMRAAGMPAGPGEVILAVAVLSIVLTAPLGAWAISLAGRRWLVLAPPGTPDPARLALEESGIEDD